MTLPRRRALRRARAFLRYFLVGTTTWSGRLADVLLILVIAVGVLALILESVPSVREQHATLLWVTEAAVGAIFVIEYGIRLWVARVKRDYVLSFWGVIDLIAILPFLFQGFGLAYLRLFRVLRIFSILKVGRYTAASRLLRESLYESRSKIAVFLLSVIVIVTVVGFTMHSLEPQTFPTVPEAIWWTVVTLSTVGYGDYVPITAAGRFLAGLTMITAYGIIAVPTGIVTAEYAIKRQRQRFVSCPRCPRSQHEDGARYCAECGEELPASR